MSRRAVNDPATAIPVLLYHRIATSSDDPYAVSPAAFAAHIEAIVASGRTALTISQLADRLAMPGELDERSVAITFDDGYAETLDAVRSVTAAGLSATVYVVTGSIGAPGMVTSDQIGALVDMGEAVEVGAHSVSHPHLDEIGRGEMVTEIVESRDALRALGVPVRSFSYPHGAYDRSVRAAVIRAGYGSAAGVKNALSHPGDDRWAIGRYTVSGRTTLEKVGQLLEGRGAPLAWQAERLRTRAYRCVRRFGRERARSGAGPVSVAPAVGVVGETHVLALGAPVAVRSLDTRRGFADIELPPARSGAPYRGLAVLVKNGDEPLGWLGIEAPAVSTVGGDVLERAYLDQLAPTGAEAPSGAEASIAAKASIDTQAAVGAKARRRPASAPPGAAPAFVSHVVTTCNQAATAVRCVRSIMASEGRSGDRGGSGDKDGSGDRGGPFEVVVVENRPTHSTVREALDDAFPGDDRVRYLEVPIPGASRARNAGLQAARGEIVVFTDDDIVAELAWCGSLRAAFAGRPDVACVTGPILPLELETSAQVLMERFSAVGDGFVRRDYSLAHPPEPHEQPLFPYTAGYFGSGGNCAFRRDVLLALDGFDRALGPGTPARGGEDLDLLIRVVLAGETLLYEPSAIVWHPHPDTMEVLSHEVFSYGIGLGAMLAKQLVAGPHRVRFVASVPRGVRYLASSGSRKNAIKGVGYPARLDRLERTGLAVGPAAYLRSRWAERRLAALPGDAAVNGRAVGGGAVGGRAVVQ